VLGHSDHELERLEQQAQIFAETTEDILRRAGLKPGMRVLDVGCGAGDVSLIAAKLVGPTGSVLGIDHAAEALQVAARRAAAAGLDQLRFEQSDITKLEAGETYDAVIGRFILMHLKDPATAIASLKDHVRPGGIIAFVEMDIEASVAIPPMPLFDQCKAWLTGLYAKVGVEPNMGSRLYDTFSRAGLTAQMNGYARVAGGETALRFEFMTPSIATLLPGIVAFGVATADEVGIDTLAARFRNDVLAGNHCFIFPRVIGAWAQVS
jgi:ubiquinone/menaquinone biosynthesis C-methylase UbiE